MAMRQHAAAWRVQQLFSLSTPPLSLLAFVNLGLSNAVFGVADVLGTRMPPRLRAAAHASFLAANVSVFGAAAVAQCAACASVLDPCTAPASLRPLSQTACLGAASASALLLFAASALDRIFVPLVGMRRDAFSNALASRASRGAALTVLWMAIAEGSILAVPLVLLLCCRRALSGCPLLNAATGTSLKAYAAVVVFQTLSGSCNEPRAIASACGTAIFLS